MKKTKCKNNNSYFTDLFICSSVSCSVKTPEPLLLGLYACMYKACVYIMYRWIYCISVRYTNILYCMYYGLYVNTSSLGLLSYRNQSIDMIY